MPLLRAVLPTNRSVGREKQGLDGLRLREISMEVGYGHMQPEPPSKLEQDLRVSRYSFFVPWNCRWPYHSPGVIVCVSGERMDGYVLSGLSGAGVTDRPGLEMSAEPMIGYRTWRISFRKNKHPYALHGLLVVCGGAANDSDIKPLACPLRKAS